jgi:integrase
MGKNQIDAFLSHLATNARVAAATQRQALNAIVFLYRHVLDQPVEDLLEPVKAKRHSRPPVVMTQTEALRVFENMQGTHLLMAKILYGGGLRLMECIRLRVQDFDFEPNLVYVRDGNGRKDRVTLLPKSLCFKPP